MTDKPTDKPMDPMKPTAAPGPADLAELKATDALLNRLAAGGLSAQDREDPLVAAFAELRVSLDAPSDDVSLDVGRLLEVLGDRPLYLVDAEEAGDGTLADSPINLGAPVGPATRTIDVRDVSADAEGAHRPPTPLRRPVLPQPAAQVAARVGGATTAAFGATVRTINSLSAGRRATHGRLTDEAQPNWRRVAAQVALPAASIVAVLTIGYGVSAAVAGDPMAPVAGMSRVVGQLPGISDTPSIEAVSKTVSRAGKLADTDPTQAKSILATANKQVGDLPRAVQPSLKSEIARVNQKIASGNTPTPAGVVTATKPATSPVATTPATPSASSTAPTSPAPSVSASATAPTTPATSAATTTAATTSPAP